MNCSFKMFSLSLKWRLVMKRVIDHIRRPNETLKEYKARIEAETLAYKTTMDYRLWYMRQIACDMCRWAKNDEIRKVSENLLDTLNTLTCTDFGENPDGTLVK